MLTFNKIRTYRIIKRFLYEILKGNLHTSDRMINCDMKKYNQIVNVTLNVKNGQRNLLFQNLLAKRQIKHNYCIRYIFTVKSQFKRHQRLYSLMAGFLSSLNYSFNLLGFVTFCTITKLR